ncbi:hypothetical protein [Hymenobacter cavernae]|uniref:Uncharacterized protein n=1 Tax=Hymenobacter cavernae TaxID=2044852 RepID=A0ABQ1UPW9_9BACT|nr:hypothetical protein [Hymenobacter cavernae]GGF24298.1 hypothetical protein GCM10011383_39920 [Hymenobacter cavernae]
MNTAKQLQAESVASASVTSSSKPAVLSQEAAQKAQAKALKKWRKNERLRFFFGWCSGCQAYGSIF